MRWLVLLLLMFPPPVLADEPFARTEIDSGEGIVPGQQVHVIVDVFAPDFFTSPPQFPLFEMPNALVTLPDARAQNMVQTIDGQQYSGIRRVYAVVPEKPGLFAIPELRIPLGWSVNGRAMTGEVTTKPIEFEVAQHTAIVFAAMDMEVTQSYDRDTSSLKVGDALVRTIVVTAAETQGLTMPAVDIGTVEGLRQYVKSPKIEERVPLGRGQTVTRRTETVVYTAEKEGTFTIPSLSYPWFDIDARRDAAATLPEREIKVAAAPAKSGIAISDERHSHEPVMERRRVMLVIVLLLVLTACVWFGRGLPLQARRLWSRLRQRRLDSYGYRLRRLRKTIRTAQPSEVYSALHGWARSEGYRTLNDWLIDRPSGVSTEVVSLERGLFGGGDTDFNRNALVSLLDRAVTEPLRPTSALPPLNPS